jgi:MFS family permease
MGGLALPDRGFGVAADFWLAGEQDWSENLTLGVRDSTAGKLFQSPRTSKSFANLFFQISWVMIEFSRTATHLYIARFMVGLGGSGFFLALPMYVAEISLDEVRGALGSIMMVSTNLGIVIGYTVNSYLDYRTVPLIVIGILLAFIVGFPFAADSPKHLMVQNKSEQAIAALKYFRGHTMSTEQFAKEHGLEIEALKAYGSSNQTTDGQKVTLQDFSELKASPVEMF